MPVTLSRHALYDLVWSEPRTELAKAFGVSNVAINKHCLRANVPAPPPGYWAKRQVGRKVQQVPLPLRLPGQSCWVVIGQENISHWRRPTQSDEPLVPPTFLEDLDAQVAKSGMAASQVNISQAAIRELQVPVCSKAEQRRIVASVNQLFALCDQLKLNLAQARQQHEHLASVLVEQAVA